MRSTGRPVRGTAGLGSSTVREDLHFRGQNKPFDTPLGPNPNANIEDEYIHNLQQQIHFMELELNILRQKQEEEEKASGLAALFNDDRNPTQHIGQLRDKYHRMTKDYTQHLENQRRQKLQVEGQNSVFKAQVNILTEYLNDLQLRLQELKNTNNARISELHRLLQQQSNQRRGLEAEIRNQNQLLEHEEGANREYHYILENEAKTKELDDDRFDREAMADTELLNMKRGELDALNVNIDQIEEEFKKNADLQKIIQQNEELKVKIADAEKEIVILDIKVKELDQVRVLDTRLKEEEIEKRRELLSNNEELKRDLEGKEKLHKMLIAKRLREGKSTQIKTLESTQITVTEGIEEIEGKIRNERDKIVRLTGERIGLELQLKHRKLDLDGVTARVDENKQKITELETVATGLRGETSDLTDKNNENRMKNDELKARNKELNEQNTALLAKLKFIEDNYDFQANLKRMNFQDFKVLCQSSTLVNQTMLQFVEKLSKVKKDPNDPFSF